MNTRSCTHGESARVTVPQIAAPGGASAAHSGSDQLSLKLQQFTHATVRYRTHSSLYRVLAYLRTSPVLSSPQTADYSCRVRYVVSPKSHAAGRHGAEPRAMRENREKVEVERSINKGAEDSLFGFPGVAVAARRSPVKKVAGTEGKDLRILAPPCLHHFFSVPCPSCCSIGSARRWCGRV